MKVTPLFWRTFMKATCPSHEILIVKQDGLVQVFFCVRET